MRLSRDLERAIQAGLDRPVRLAVARRPLSPSRLSRGEAVEYSAKVGDVAARDWLLGRAALRRVLRALREPPDTAGFRFPNVRFSVAHSGGHGIALGSRDGQGFGVDLELRRPSSPAAGRVFLNKEEEDWVHTRSAALRSREITRLWAVKEALFKADLANDGRTVADYTILEPGATVGSACRNVAPRIRFQYVVLPFLDGFVAAAANEEK